MKDKMKFLPLLFYYAIVVLILYSNSFWGDESRYIMFANNLLQGFYSPGDEVYLWNGPGYPIVLVPFVFFELPWLAVKMLNALFLFMAILYFYSALRLYMKERYEMLFAYLLGIYPPFLRHIHQVLTEPFSVFLVCGFLYHFCNAHRKKENSQSQILIASFYLGYLSLTKIFFGYVILAGLLFYLGLYIINKSVSFKKSFLIYVLALFLCVPYLFYTYSQTGKIFYWGNAGGLSLYWMSTPYPGELGDWHMPKVIKDNPKQFENHKKLFDKLETMPSIQRDDELKRHALENISNNPLKYFTNWIANVGRLLFNYPYSFTEQKLSTFIYIIPNMFIVVIFVFCLFPAVLARRLIPHEIYSLLFFVLIAFGGSSLLSAYNRLFWPLVPLVIFWISFIIINVIRLEIKR